MGIFGKTPEPTKPKFVGVPLNERRRWTKEEIKILVQIWNDHTMEEICKTLDRTPSGVGNIVHALRKMGVKMNPKRIPSGPVLKDKIKEVLDELGLAHN